MAKRSKIIILLIVILLVVGAGYIFARRDSKPGELDSFAQCLKDKGALFYGAFWCPHCQNQKALFGKSEKILPYVECSTPDGKEQLPICRQKNIDGYPTWEFTDGTRETGEIPLGKLSQKSGCPLPQ